MIPNRTMLDRMNIPEGKLFTRANSADKYNIPIPEGFDLKHMEGNKKTYWKDYQKNNKNAYFPVHKKLGTPEQGAQLPPFGDRTHEKGIT
jgi:hypothetical protein